MREVPDGRKVAGGPRVFAIVAGRLAEDGGRIGNEIGKKGAKINAGNYILDTLAQEKSKEREGTPERAAMWMGLSFSMRPSLAAWE